jgi:hypothetical protein
MHFLNCIAQKIVSLTNRPSEDYVKVNVFSENSCKIGGSLFPIVRKSPVQAIYLRVVIVRLFLCGELLQGL